MIADTTFLSDRLDERERGLRPGWNLSSNPAVLNGESGSKRLLKAKGEITFATATLTLSVNRED